MLVRSKEGFFPKGKGSVKLIIESDVKHFSTRYVVGKYRISSIHFFDKNGIVCETDWGYLEHYENYICQRIPSFEIKNQDTIKLKRKLDFNTKEAFLFESKRNWDNALTTKLYIPFIKEDWDIVEVWEIDMGNPAFENLWRKFHHKESNALIKVKITQRDTIEKSYIDNLTEIMRLTHYDKENMKLSQNDMVNNKEKILKLMKEIIKTL
jgi:hypothetical protein